MPDTFDANGLQVATAAEITGILSAGMQTIYGADINLGSNSPDGQFIGIITQLAVDLRELLVQINTSFDPDEARGVVLDQRCTLNNVTREGGTYTTQPIDIQVNKTVPLPGLDAEFNNPNGTGYTVQDDDGNKFILIDSITLISGTTTSCSFRAQQIGEVNVPVNTIINPVTIVQGVVSVNNSSAATTVGSEQETDPQLRLRRSRSVALSSNGYLNGLLGYVETLPGVTEAAIYENVTDSVDDNGIPAHGIWLIVGGGANTDIAQAIYGRKSYGANMKGDVAVNIETPSGSTFTAKFDRPVAEPLYIRFSLQTTIPGTEFDEDSIKEYIVSNIIYQIGGYAETSSLTAASVAAVADQGGGGVPVLMQISSDGATWTDFIEPATLASQWTLDVGRISISVIA